MFNYDESFFVEKEIAVPAEKAWDIIALPGGLMLWHPFMEKHIAESWNGVGSKDHLTYYSGFEFDREVVKWIEGIGYDLEVKDCIMVWVEMDAQPENKNKKQEKYL